MTTIDARAARADRVSVAPFAFPAVLEYSARRRFADRDDARRFSSRNVFVNNGDTYNAKHIVRRLTDGPLRRRRRPRDEDADGTTGRHDAAALARLTDRQYETYPDRRSAVGRGFAAETSEDERQEQDERREQDEQQDDDDDDDDDGTVTVLTTLRRPAGDATGGRPAGCEVVAKDDGAALMRCAAAVFDVTAGADDELRDARAAFRRVHGELMKCGDEQLARLRDDGAVRCFVLVTTAASWAGEPVADDFASDESDGYRDYGDCGEEERPRGGPGTTGDPLKRAPATARCRDAFELEKAVLRANVTRTRHVFRGRVIGAGVTYGHEQRALRRVFERAWLGDDDDDDDDWAAYAALGRRTVPAVHVDELAELVRVTCARGRRAGPSADDPAYALALERPSYEFADVVDAVRDAFCARPRRRHRHRHRRPRAGKSLPAVTFKNYDGWPQHGHPNGRPVSPPTYDADADRYGLGRGFALDLILGDLDADHPALRDFIAAPCGRYGASPSSLVPAARRLASEYVAARGLRSFRLLVSGRPRRVAARVAARLARRYRVPLVDAGRAIDDRADRLRAVLDDRRAPSADRPAAAAEDEEWTADESAYYARASGNVEDDDDDDGLYDDGLRDDGGGDDDDELLLRSYAIGIHDIERALTDLNVEREHLGRSVDPVHLLPLIRESLSSCSCRNRGYVMDVFPLSVERMDVIFDGDVDSPNAVIMLSYDPDDLDEITTGSSVVVDDDEDNRHRSRHDHRRMDRDSDSSETDSSDGYFDRQDDRGEIDIEADDDYAEVIDEENLRDLTVESSYEKNKVEMKRVIKYFTDKRCKVLNLKVPFGLIDETVPNDWQYTGFTESIVTQVGRPQFSDDVYETTVTETKQTMTAESKTRKTNMMSRKVLEKLNAMREEWNDDIFKAIERDKSHENNKNNKIQNFVNTNILPKLLKEISSIRNRDVYSVSRCPEKTLNKTKLCCTQSDED